MTGMTKDQSAPGSLELVREFVNSVDVERPEEDSLRDEAPAQKWMLAHGLEAPALDSVQLSGLRELREAIRAELLSHTGVEGHLASWPVLITLIQGAELKLAFDAHGNLELAPDSRLSGAGKLRGLVAAAIYDAVRVGTWPRLKACRKHSCLFAFYDHSKNGSGAWCDMGICGNRVKAARRRARERKTGAI
jgi:predicted RNA-binding Zn ribbon-like protein